MIEVDGPQQALRQDPGGRRAQLPGRAGHDHRLPRPERRRQVDDAALGARARPSRCRPRDRPRRPLRASSTGRSIASAPCSRRARCIRAAPGETICACRRPRPGCPRRGSTEVLALVELSAAAKRRVKGYSLGMRQRLGLATALLGDPEVLVLDEPANGLDPAGIRWLRDLLRSLAAEGRTVLVSSHVLSEVAQTADHVVIIHRGRLIQQAAMADVLARRERLDPRADAGRGASARAPRRGERGRLRGRGRRAARERRRRSGSASSRPRTGSCCTSSASSRRRSRRSSSS